jgi:hypothetical protein
MRKLGKYFVDGVICLLVIISIIYIALTFFASYREYYSHNTIAVDISIKAENEDLISYYQALLPLVDKYVNGYNLSGIRTVVVDQDFSGIVFFFFDYINDYRVGGNIRQSAIYINPQSSKIYEIRTFEGAGRASYGWPGDDTPFVFDHALLSAEQIFRSVQLEQPALNSDTEYIDAWFWQDEAYGLMSKYKIHPKEDDWTKITYTWQ